ncbi:MAG TPA: PAS domain S-box protein [Rubricoccaceae bacterium]|nr:PAS domain S-box protein [Rubricoccaceae bacterium]
MPNNPRRYVLQQAVLAELGLRSLEGTEPRALAAYAAHAAADALGVPLVAVLERRGDGFALAAGHGWPDALDGQPFVTERDAHVAEALAAGEPVPLAPPVPEALAREGVVSGLTIRLGGAGEPAGLFGVYAREPHDFDAEALAFVAAVGAVLTGVSERADTARALAESEARARAMLETTVDGVVTIDATGIIEGFNPAAERIFGYRADEVIGKNVNVLMPEPYHSEHDGYIQAYHETGHRRIIGIGREVVGRRKSGETFPMDLAVSEVQLPGRKIFTGFIRDISARRELEQEVLRIAEAERRRIGQDLHDGLGQMLTGTALIARGLARRLRMEESPAAADADEVVRLIKDADTYARSLARGLVPVELDAGGLDAALERLCANAERLFGIACTFEPTGDPGEVDHRLPDEAPTHLFRIAQEAVSNAVRHGQARHVHITLMRAPDRLRLVVRDDGTGFPALVRSAGSDRLDERTLEGPAAGAAPARPHDNRGMGVRIMHYRARILGGALEIRPFAKGGTIVTCTVPVRRAPASTLTPADEDAHPRR